LVKAQNLLLQEALRDLDNERFIFLSNSCIPLKPFDFVYDGLFSRDLCYFNLARHHHIFEQGRGLNLEKRFGKANVRKSSQWSILTREIAQILSESNPELEKLFEAGKKDLADEYFYISYLFYLGRQQHLHIYDYAASDAKTFEYWNDKDYEYNKEFTTEHPENWDRKLKTFYNISAEELLFLLNAPCYFGRKFSNNCTVNGKELISDRIASHYNL
jgi:hypothetical protein